MSRLSFPCSRCTLDEKPGSQTRTYCNGACHNTTEDAFDIGRGALAISTPFITPFRTPFIKAFERDLAQAATSAPKEAASVLGTQVGGSHYTDCAIQPIEYIWANNLGFSEGNIVKYVTRWKAKGGIKDLKKAHHHLALLIEQEEKKASAS